MTLRKKAVLWIAMLALVATTNAIIGIYSLRSINRITLSAIEEHQVAANARGLRTLMFGFQRSLFTAMLTGSAQDRAVRKAYRTAIEHELRADRYTEISPQRRRDVASMHLAILRLLAALPEDEEPTRETLLSPRFRALIGNVELELHQLVTSVDLELLKAEERMVATFRRAQVILGIALAASVALLAMGVHYLRRRILRPFHEIHRITEAIHSGDLTRRWRGGSTDEIGAIGSTLNRLMEQLEFRRRERIEVIGSVAHDLKNPLSTLSLECQLLRRHPSRLTPEKAPEIVGRLERQIEKLWRLSEDLLQAAKEARGKWQLFPRAFALGPLLIETLQDFRARHADHTYRYSGPGEALKIVADRVRIAQVLENLVSNATKYSPPGTEVEVRLEDLGHEVEIKVLDRGIGVPKERREEIFRTFSRAEKGRLHAQGTGLGLAIVREIVDLHGGMIGCDDREGGGSVFRVLLPKQPPTTARGGELDRVA